MKLISIYMLMLSAYLFCQEPCGIYYTTHSYDENGRKKRSDHYDILFADTYDEYNYTDTLMVRQVRYFETGQVLSEVNYEYSSRKMLVKRTEQHFFYVANNFDEGSTGSNLIPINELEVTNYSYSPDGNLIYHSTLLDTVVLSEVIIEYSAGRPVREINNPNDSAGRYEVLFDYDNSGRKSKEIHKYADASYNGERIFSYDAKGRLVKKDFYRQSKLYSYDLYVYSSNGLLNDIFTYTEGQDDLSSQRIHFEYDAKGNLIKECDVLTVNSSIAK